MCFIDKNARLIGCAVDKLRSLGAREPGFLKVFVLSAGILIGLLAGRRRAARCAAVSGTVFIFSGLFLIYKAKECRLNGPIKNPE